MHSIVLLGHSYLRWVVLALVTAVTLLALLAWRRQSRDLSGKLGLAATISLDLQLTTGLLLYLWPGSVARLAISDAGAAMRNAGLRFWGIEHVTLMVLAVVIVHVGRILVRRANTALLARRRAAVSWLVALVLILVAIPWPFRALIGRPLFRF